MTIKSRIQLTKKSGSLFYAISQVLKARDKSGEIFSQFSLGYVKVEENRIMAADGHCLCVAELPEKTYTPGFYVVVKDLKSRIDLMLDHDAKGLSFPKVKPIIDFDYSKIDTKEVDVFGDRCSGVSVGMTRIVRAMATDLTINIKLLSKFKDMDTAIVPTGAVSDYGTPVLLVSSGVKAFVMPMRM